METSKLLRAARGRRSRRRKLKPFSAGSRVIVQTKSKVWRKNEANSSLSFCGDDRVRFGRRGWLGAGDGSNCRDRPRSKRSGFTGREVTVVQTGTAAARTAVSNETGSYIL